MATMIPSSAQALYAHIHRLLDEHIAVHLTTDYIDCTQLRVFQALTGSLLPVSVDDPYSLVLPSDPLDKFIKEHCQIQMKDICERFPAAKETQELIHCIINAKPTFASSFDDTFCGYSQNTDIFADPSVLSVYSIWHTPKPGRSKTPHLFPLNLKEVLGRNSVGPTPIEEDEETDAQTKDVLHCRLAVDHHDLKKISLSYQASPFSTTYASRTQARESLVCNQFPCRTPSPPLLAPLPHTPPLFSRKDLASKQPAHVPASMSDLQLVAPSICSDGDEGMLEYAVVDDEWATSSLTSSTVSPPTPCLSNTPSKRVEFFVPSSEPQGPIDDLLAAKIDMFHMPRQSRAGGSREAFRVPGQGQQFHEYIGSALCSTRGRDITTAPSSAPNTIVTPPTSVHRVGVFPTPDNVCRSSDDSEDAFIGQVMLDFADEAIDAVLLDKLADTRSGLMTVPQLPAPNVHIRNTLWPNDMKSLVTYKCFSAFNVVKGIKSLNLELTWRPYDSEQAIPTVEELVGVSELHYFLANISVHGDDAKSQLVELLSWLDSLTQPVSIEEESPGKLQAVSRSLDNFDFATVVPNPPDCELSNVLPTRAERLRSRLLPRTQLDRAYEHAGQWDGGGCTVQSQSLGRSKADSPSEDNYYRKSTELGSEDPDPVMRGRTLLYSDPSKDVALDAEIDMVSSAPHVQLPVESTISLSPVGLSPDSDSISGVESSRGPNPDWIHQSKSGGFEDNHQLTTLGPATCEEQTLRGYLKILAKQSPSGPADNDMHPSSPACSEIRRLSTSPADTEGLLRDLSKLAAPLPPLGAPSNYNHHRYLASIELLQDRPLMHAFRFDSLRMELLEREWVDGADIVFDCDTALIFVSLFQVLHPTTFRSLKDRLCLLSWRYIQLAVVFNLYGAGTSGLQHPQDEEEVIRSIKKLQRGLGLAEAYATKRPQTVIQIYFVRSVEQAAETARLLGNVAESRSPFGPWGDRLWLGVDEKEEERYLAGVDGMNAFSAAVILSQISLHDFLALRADQRLQLALPIPESMMERFNEVIAQRREDVDIFVGDEDGV